MMQSRPPPAFAYGLVLFLGAAMVPFLFSLDKTISVYTESAFRRSLSAVSLYSLKDADQYSNLQATQDIDSSIEERAQKNDAKDRCSRLFLYLPDLFAEHGHGSQINTYILGVTTSTFLNRAMVLVEPPLEVNKYAGGSQFGCPIDAFRETMTKTSLRQEAKWQVPEDFPRGLSRLVQQPAWLSHGCALPCAETHGYQDWVKLALSPDKGELEEITCPNPDGTESSVMVSTGNSLMPYFREHEFSMTSDRFSAQATQWALNLGATPQEAEIFSNIKHSRPIWDYVLGLMNKAGFLKLQPWIARDVQLFLKSFKLPFQSDYDAIHVRRGDKLITEAHVQVLQYWKSQGHTDMENLPTNYVPFAHYLSKWDEPDKCSTNDKGEVQVMPHNVYVATDDPIVVREEIAALPNHINENTILWKDCHQLTFFFNPTDDSAFHLNGDGEKGFEEGNEVEGGDSCFGRYHRNIVSIADMMILSKARMFIGEYNSNWGRLIRTMRVRLNTPVAQDDSDIVGDGNVVKGQMVQRVDRLTKTLDTRIAWGPTMARTPGK